VVLVTVDVPRPGLAGHLSVNHAALAYLASRGHRLHLLLPAPRLDAPVIRLSAELRGVTQVEGPGLRQIGDRVVAAPRQALTTLARRALLALPAGPRDALRGLARGGRFAGAEVVLGTFLTPQEIDWTAARIAALRPRAVLIDTIFRAPLLRHPALAGLTSVILTHDVFHRRHASLRARGLGVFPPRLSEAEERDLLAGASVVAAIQPEEEEALRALLPGHRVILAGMPALPCPRPASVRREAGLVVFLGSDSPHNLDGLRWFLDAAWPLVRAAAPDARLEICGTAGRALASLPPGVTARGVVADLAPVLHRAAVAVAPVLAGSGLKIKMLDYLAHGLRVVATPLAAAGLPLDDDVPIAVADRPENFAAAVLDGLTEQAALAAETPALAWLARHYAPDQALGALAEAVEAR
jgi:hypothetical protein